MAQNRLPALRLNSAMSMHSENSNNQENLSARERRRLRMMSPKQDNSNENLKQLSDKEEENEKRKTTGRRSRLKEINKTTYDDGQSNQAFESDEMERKNLVNIIYNHFYLYK